MEVDGWMQGDGVPLPPPVCEQVGLVRLALHRQVVAELALEALGALAVAEVLAHNGLGVHAWGRISERRNKQHSNPSRSLRLTEFRIEPVWEIRLRDSGRRNQCGVKGGHQGGRVGGAGKGG